MSALERLLERLARGGVFTTPALARELDLSPEMVEALLEGLRRAGYLCAAAGCPDARCGACGAKRIARQTP